MIFGDQSHPTDIENIMIKGHAETLKRACDLMGVKPKSVRSVIELGGGVGRNTKAILEVFPQAMVKVISFTDERDSDLKVNKRVNFFQGQFVEVLKSGQAGQADVVVLKDAGRGHGFNKDTIGFLAKAVGQGILITGGDNGSLYDQSFYDHFSQMKTVDEGETYAWRAK